VGKDLSSQEVNVFLFNNFPPSADLGSGALQLSPCDPALKGIFLPDCKHSLLLGEDNRTSLFWMFFFLCETVALPGFVF